MKYSVERDYLNLVHLVTFISFSLCTWTLSALANNCLYGETYQGTCQVIEYDGGSKGMACVVPSNNKGKQFCLIAPDQDRVVVNGVSLAHSSCVGINNPCKDINKIGAKCGCASVGGSYSSSEDLHCLPNKTCSWPK